MNLLGDPIALALRSVGLNELYGVHMALIQPRNRKARATERDESVEHWKRTFGAGPPTATPSDHGKRRD